MAAVKIIYYMDILSSWCTYAEGALAKVRSRFASGVDYEWRIAALHDGNAMGYTPEAMQWYYERSGSMSGMKLNNAWLESERDGSWWPNLAAEAARSLGRAGDEVRLAISKAGLIEGQHVQKREVAERIAAAASGLDSARLRAAMDDPAVADRIRATTAEFRALPCTMVPTFLISSEIGDVNLLSGTYRYEHIAACVEQLLADAKAYAEFGKAHPPPASVKG
ncbi:MAG TPA: DsbA family protein [Candidatus Eremiobacteraceae bacterium]|nr:DsbA family protein [Candidatus Eremiobacteraceae bacterium]